MAVSFAVRIGAGEPLLRLPMLLPLPVDASGAVTWPIKTIAMLAGLLTMWAVSRLTTNRCAPVALSAQ
jgi:high affinity choline transporter 7